MDRPRSNALRKGRWSETGRVYVVTTVTMDRKPHFLDFQRARRAIACLRHCDDRGMCRTLAFVLMPDHLHWLVELGDSDLSAVVRQFKAGSARAMNIADAAAGRPVWQRGFHDRAVRREEDLQDVARYLAGNPLRAEIVRQVGDYPHWDAVWVDGDDWL